MRKPTVTATVGEYAYPIVAVNMPQVHTARMKNLAAIREAHGLTQTQLADKIGANQATISKIERGIANPTFSMIKRIAAALSVDPIDFFETDELRFRLMSAVDALDPERQEAALIVIESMAGR